MYVSDAKAFEQPVTQETAMHTNVGSLDRLVRIVFGLALLVLPFIPGITVFTSPLAFWAALVIGLVLVVTAVVRFCPLYSLFGLTTCKVTH